MTVLTIGHSTRSAAELLDLLERHGATTLVDVRRYPVSRRYPHFAAPALRASLQASGREYVHEPDLGGHREPRPDSPNLGLRVAAFRGYADHMASPEFQAALERLLVFAARGRPCLMCAEALPSRCHRQLLADALVARGVDVRHILDAAPPAPHALHPRGRPGPGGALLYPKPSGREPRRCGEQE